MTQLQGPPAPPPDFWALNADIVFLLLGIYGYIFLFIKGNERAHDTVKVGILPVAAG